VARTFDRLGVLGGTFDPLHAAHLRVATRAQEALALDHVIFIPAGEPWRKAGRPITAGRHRLAMVRAAVAGADRFQASDLELRRAGPTYTTDTLRTLRDRGHAQIWFIVGSDALADMPHWHEPQELIRLARIAVIARPGATLDAAQLDNLVPGLSRVVDWVEMPPSPIAATDLRQRLAANDDPALANEIPAPTLAYIRRHGLYRVAPYHVAPPSR
jgi:nicotinate-nucleotide adenylyltransferase